MAMKKAFVRNELEELRDAMGGMASESYAAYKGLKVKVELQGKKIGMLEFLVGFAIGIAIVSLITQFIF